MSAASVLTAGLMFAVGFGLGRLRPLKRAQDISSDWLRFGRFGRLWWLQAIVIAVVLYPGPFRKQRAGARSAGRRQGRSEA